MLWIDRPILDRFLHRFLLRDYQQGKDEFTLNSGVQIVDSISRVLETAHSVYLPAVDLSPAAGTPVVAMTVGKHERIVLNRIVIPATTANTQVRVARKDGGDNWIPLAASGNAETFLNQLGITMYEGDTLTLNTTGNGADNATRAFIDYVKEPSWNPV